MAARFTRAAQDRCVEHMAETGNISQAALHAGVARETVYQRIRADAAFAERMVLARDAAYDRLQREAIRRAVAGVEEPMVQGGEVVRDTHGLPITVRRYSDRLLLFMIRRLDRESQTGELADGIPWYDPARQPELAAPVRSIAPPVT